MAKKTGVRLQCPEMLEEGVYTFDPARGAWVPGEARRGLRVYVFVNAICTSACCRVIRLLEEHVGDLVAKGIVRIILVVCTRFRYVCSSTEAKRLFQVYQVIASPSVAVLDDNRELAVLKGWMRIEEELPSVLEELRRASREQQLQLHL